MKNLFSVLFSKILILFGKKYSKDVIPLGSYCYILDEKTCGFDKGIINIIPCPYYKYVSKNYSGCKYLGIVTNDFLLNDQCKICGVKE